MRENDGYSTSRTHRALIVPSSPHGTGGWLRDLLDPGAEVVLRGKTICPAAGRLRAQEIFVENHLAVPFRELRRRHHSDGTQTKDRM